MHLDILARLTRRSSAAPRASRRRETIVFALLLFLIGCASCRGSSPQPRAENASPTGPPAETDASESRADDEDKAPSANPGDRERNTKPRPPAREPHRLGSFFRALTEAEDSDTDRRARILHIGDSHTASDTITGRIRRLFQDRFGATGRGYAYPGVPWRTFRQELMSYDMSEHWRVSLGIDDDAAPPFALGGVRISSENDEAWLERGSCGLKEEEDDETSTRSDEDDRKECPHGVSLAGVAVHYLEQPEGGSFVVTVDDREPTVVDTSGNERRLGIYERGLEPGRHRVRIRPKGDGPVSLFGLHTSGEADNGVEYSSLGLNGAKASEFVSFDAELTEETIDALDPDLVVVAFGTNTAFDLYRMHDDPEVPLETVTERLARYQVQFDRLLERYSSAAPNASCLVMLPPDTAPKRENETCRRSIELRGEEICIPATIRNFEGVVAAQRTAARRHNCAIWNQSKAMGGEGSIRRWRAVKPPLAQSDGVHLTMDGYHVLADAFFSDVMQTYRSWRDRNAGPLETNEIDIRNHLRSLRDAPGPQ